MNLAPFVWLVKVTATLGAMAELRSVLMKLGAQSVTNTGITLMQALRVVN